MAIDDLIKDSEKLLGYSVIQRASAIPHFKHISTGSFTLDLALLGGIPQGLCTMFIGKQHSGKTLMALKSVGNFQRYYDGSSEDRPKKYAVWVVVGEGIFPTAWARTNGVNTEELVVMYPPDGDAAIDLTCAAMENDEVCVVVFDAIPGIVGKAELEKSVEDALKPGSVASPLQRMLRKCSTTVAKSLVSGDLKTMILINQWRDGISMNPAIKAPRSVPGGKYARHYNSCEVEMYNEEEVGKSEDGLGIVANKHSFKIHKNKCGNSIREGEFKMIRGINADLPPGTIDDADTVARYGQKFGLVGGAGKGWWMIDPFTGEELKYGSKSEIVDHLRGNPDFKYQLERLIIGKHRVTQGLSETGWY